MKNEQREKYEITKEQLDQLDNILCDFGNIGEIISLIHSIIAQAQFNEPDIREYNSYWSDTMGTLIQPLSNNLRITDEKIHEAIKESIDWLEQVMNSR
ncbi:hypothetical protein [Facklamia hominis]|uniref:Uncharacterized protein n=1 Tax=Facklamia hominis TaxID=178214 RepID=A0AAJ1V3J5_9LACT|nr:hypothetical protein [Facklamia hominis]MDK7187506.1 hypothetical protein [Facklamia hominis]